MFLLIVSAIFGRFDGSKEAVWWRQTQGSVLDIVELPNAVLQK